MTTRPSTSPAGVSTTTRATTTLLSGVVSTTRPVTIPAVTSIVISFIRIQTTTKRTITTKPTTTSAYSFDWYSSACYFNTNTTFPFGLQLTTAQCVTVCIESSSCTHYTVDTSNKYCWLHYGNVRPQDALKTTNYNYGCGIIALNRKINNNQKQLGSINGNILVED